MSEELVQIRAVSRRSALRGMASALGAGLAVPGPDSAQHLHDVTNGEQASAGTYSPKLFNPHEYATLRCLAELIIPADEHSGGGLDASAPEYIDLLCSQNSTLASVFTGGLLWLDHEMQRHHASNFVDAPEDRQIAMLDLLSAAQPVPQSGVTALGPGREFFRWVARMTVDAFYTSAVGIKDIGYLGNKGMTKYSVPEEAIQYALRRGPTK